jgi:hypothetical protein
LADVKIELNTAAIRELLRSDEVAQACEAEAARMTRATGMAYQADVYVGRNRVNAAGYRKEADDD